MEEKQLIMEKINDESLMLSITDFEKIEKVSIIELVERVETVEIKKVQLHYYKRKNDGKEVIIKTLKFKPQIKNVEKKIKEIEHCNKIIGVYGFVKLNPFGIVMETMTHSLHDEIYEKEPNRLTIEKQLRVISHILEALKVLHEHSFVHGNLNPQNILVSEESPSSLNSVYKISDICESKSGCSATHSFTPLSYTYASPEMRMLQLENTKGRLEKITTNTDVFSLGVIIMEMCSKVPPPDPPNISFKSRVIPDTQFRTLPQEPSLRQIAEDCIVQSYKKRKNAKELFEIYY